MPPRECERLFPDGGDDAKPPGAATAEPPRRVCGYDALHRSGGTTSRPPSAPSPPRGAALPPVRRIRLILLIRFLFFALSFSIAESALVVSVSLAARLFGPTGSMCVGAMYVAYAIGTLFAGQVIRWTTRGGGGGGALKPSLAIGQACLVPFHAAGLWAVVMAGRSRGGEGGDAMLEMGVQVDGPTAALLALSASIAGASAGIAWAAAGAFITNVSLAVSSVPDEGDDYDTSDFDDVELVDRSHSREERGKRWINNDDNDAVTSQPSAATTFRHRFLNAPLLGPLLRTDFRSLAGNLTGLFNVILLLYIFLGHAWSAWALSPENCSNGSCVARTYGAICLAGIAGVVMMVFLVQDPEVEVPTAGLYSSLTKEDTTHHGEDVHAVAPQHHSKSDEKTALSKVLSDIQFTFTTPQISSLAWTHLASGFTEGLLLCYVGGSLITNPSNIGILGGVKTASSALGAPVFSLLGNDAERFGRVKVLVVGAASYMCAVAMVMFVARNNENRVRDDDDMAALLLVYALAGIGFSTWQGTAGGAFLSEIAAVLSSGHDKEKAACGGGEEAVEEDSTAIVAAAAFSSSKALSGTATAVAFFVFSRKEVPYPLIVGWCFVSTAVGLLKVVLSERRGVWSSLLISEREKQPVAAEATRTRRDYMSIQV